MDEIMKDVFSCALCGTTVLQPSDKESDPTCKCDPIRVTGEGRNWRDMQWVGQVEE